MCVLAIITLIIGVSYFVFNGNFSNYNQFLSPKSFSVVKKFPDFSNYSGWRDIKLDSQDPSSIWILGGGILHYDLKKNVVNKILAGDDGVQDVPISIVHIGDNLFYSFQGGIEKINLKNGKTKLYGQKNGLVSESNVYLHLDPYDNDVIWIGTFKGLSKFSISKETFTNFTDQIGTNSTHFGIDDNVRVGKDYVWVVVSANAYSEGGIARYDKRQKEWKAWGPEYFGSVGRVDIMAFDIDEEKAFAFVSDSDNIFEYDPVTNSWQTIYDGDRMVSNFSFLVFANNRVYFAEDDVKNSKMMNIKYVDLKTNKSLIWRNLPRGNFDVDKSEKRAIISFYSYERNLSDHKLGVIDFKDLSTTDYLVDIKDDNRLIFNESFKDVVLFETRGFLYLYNKKSNIVNKIPEINLDSNSLFAEMVDDKLIIFNLDIQEIGWMGDKPNTIYVIDPISLEVENKAVINSGEYDNISYDKEIKELILSKIQGPNKIIMYHISSTKVLEAVGDNKLDNDELMIVPEAEHSKYYGVGKNSLDVLLDDGVTVRAPMYVNGDTFQLVVTKDGINSSSSPIMVAPARISPFGYPSSIDIKTIDLDDKNSSVVWVGTDRGLVRYDINNREQRLFTIEDGLIGDDILKIDAGERFIIKHTVGVYVYDIKD